MGNPFDEKLQREILMEGLKYLKQIENPGTMVDLTGIYRTNRGECKFCGVEGQRIR